MCTYREDSQGNLILEDGTVIPEALRERAEVYSRVVGYLRPVEQWNAGKQAEFADRRAFRLAPPDVQPASPRERGCHAETCD